MQNIFPQHNVRQGTTANSKLGSTVVSAQSTRLDGDGTHQMPQSRSTESLFSVRSRSRASDVRDDCRRRGARGAVTPACAHCDTKALCSSCVGECAIYGVSAPRSRMPQSYSESSSMLPNTRAHGRLQLRAEMVLCAYVVGDVGKRWQFAVGGR